MDSVSELPDIGFLRELDGRAALIANPTKRLQFLRREIAAYAVPEPEPVPTTTKPASRSRLLWAGCALLVAGSALAVALNWPRITRRATTASAKFQPADPEGAAPPAVWLLETRAGMEAYSNGLRVENDFLVPAPPRQYRTLSRGSLEPSEVRTAPAGIVYHTTESRTVPFEAPRSESIARDGLATLAYVRENRLYHFVIDRFGQVHRVVAETGGANHAGFSVWADEHNVYLNLNQSFIGVSFEANSGLPAEGYTASPAQLFAARVLTEMLRSRYGIADVNCVTHAQVSVNPGNLRIGYHTDWARNFPFEELGLRHGYQTAVASITVFGFAFDSSFLSTLGADAWEGLALAEEHLVRDAAASGIPLANYRRMLHGRYQQAAAALRSSTLDAENGPAKDLEISRRSRH